MSISPKNKKIIFISTITFDSFLKSLFLLFFFGESLIGLFFAFLFLILIVILFRGLLKNYIWSYELLIGYGTLTFVLGLLISIPFLFFSFFPPLGSTSFVASSFIAGIVLLISCIPTRIMIKLAREYKSQAKIK